MKIATWNINECVSVTCDLDKQKNSQISQENMDEIVTIINQYDFDVVCFQEYAVFINGHKSLSRQITKRTPLKYFFSYDTYDSYHFDGGRTGVAIFSKYKIERRQHILFANPDMAKTAADGETYHSVDKAILKADIRIGGKSFTIINGHAVAFAPYGKTEFDYPESYWPLEAMVMRNIDKNLVVLGDFNTEHLFTIMPAIQRAVADVVKMPTTKDYYEKRGEVQMDYILINGKTRASNVCKIDNFSDHYIIAAEIR